MKTLIILCCFLSAFQLCGQTDSTAYRKINFNGDFRFRVEHDWNSRNADGNLRNDRSRLRYRFRFGLEYVSDQHSSFGGRLRSGNLNDQQGPHVTLGGNTGEFRLVSIGLEKLYYQFKSKHFTGFVGKNSIPLTKMNEMFWNDNVFPEGIGMRYTKRFSGAAALQKISLHGGHFIIRSNNLSFALDSYLQIAQITTTWRDGRVKIFPGFYYFNDVGNLPDEKQTFTIDYTIAHLGVQLALDRNKQRKVEAEIYHNLQDYTANDSIPAALQNQNTGIVLGLRCGSLKQRGNWLVYLSYVRLQKYAVVDYFAQNDWARWDYSSVGATGARLTNLHGTELKIGYAVKQNFNLNVRFYLVEQLVKIGQFKETGSRIRLDMNVKF